MVGSTDATQNGNKVGDFKATACEFHDLHHCEVSVLFSQVGLQQRRHSTECQMKSFILFFLCRLLDIVHDNEADADDSAE